MTFNPEILLRDAYAKIESLRAELSKPTGLVRVKECELPNYQRDKHPLNCPYGCHGTGFIRTPMTQKEVVEAFKAWANPDAERQYYYSQDDGKIFIMLSSGETVEVEG